MGVPGHSRIPWSVFGSTTKRAVAVAAAFTSLYALWLIVRLGGDAGLRFLSDIVYQLPPMGAAGACALAAARARGRERQGWAAIAAGVACWGVAEWIWTSYDLFFQADVPLFSAADPFYYLGYPFVMAGVMLLVSTPSSSYLDGKSLLDALLLATVLGVLGWVYWLVPLYENTDASSFDMVVTFGYPALDLALVAAIILAFYRIRGALPLPALLLMAAAVVMTFTDAVYLYLATVSGYDLLGDPLDLGWIVSYCLFGIAAVAHIEQEAERRAIPRPALSGERRRLVGLVLPYVALVPLLILNMYELGGGHAAVALSVGTIVATSLVLARQFFTVQELSGSRGELERLNQQLQESMGIEHHLARTDALTGIPNRRFIEETIAMELSRVNRYGQDLAIVMADLDDLKEINDRYGHEAGDGILRFVAELARQSCRQVDVVGRYGGDEFVFVLPSTNSEGAVLFAERFREQLAAKPVSIPEIEPLRLTVSLGVASWDRDSMANPAALISQADRAMYQAKSGGRNRTEVAGTEAVHAA